MQRVACYVALRRATSHFDPPQRATRKGRSAAALALFGLIADAVAGLRFSVSRSKNAVGRLSLASADDVSPELDANQWRADEGGGHRRHGQDRAPGRRGAVAPRRRGGRSDPERDKGGHALRREWGLIRREGGVGGNKEVGNTDMRVRRMPCGPLSPFPWRRRRRSPGLFLSCIFRK